MKASVLVCTYRTGGIDLIFKSLAAQAEKDFEIVLIDDLWEYRHTAVELLARSLNLNLVYPHHAPPKVVAGTPSPLGIAAASEAENKAIVHAHGELCLWLCDYSWVPPCWVEEHWKTYARGKTCSAVAGTAYHQPLPLQQLELERLPTGMIHPYSPTEDGGISIFSETINAVGELPPEINEERDLRFSLPEGETPNGLCVLFFKNEGVPLQALLEVNGVESIYDENHLYGDADLFVRLATIGWKFAVNKKCETAIVQVRSIMGTLHWPNFIQERQEALFRRQITKLQRAQSYRASGPDLKLIRSKLCTT